MLTFGAAAIGLQKKRKWGEAVAVSVGKFGAEFEQEGEAIGIQSLAWSHYYAGRGACAHGLQAAGGFDPALQAGAVEGMLQVFGTQLAQHGDNRVLANVGGVGHGRTPIAL